jgi:restriction endonuclease fold toxin 7 of polymorphic toxin system
VRAVEDIGEKKPISINDRRRIPDGVNRQTRVLTEIKNVRQLSFARQLHDLADYARQEGLRFDLWVPKGEVQLSRPLQDAIAQGRINLRRIP